LMPTEKEIVRAMGRIMVDFFLIGFLVGSALTATALWLTL
jgi:hypothetical protein